MRRPYAAVLPALLALSAALATPRCAGAQDRAGGPPERPDDSAAVSAPPSGAPLRRVRAWPAPAAHAAPAGATAGGAAPSVGLVTGASLLLPGTGQLVLGQRRWIVYAALELAGWAFHLDRRRTGRRLRGEYRDLAWTEARGAAPQPRLDGDFEYYEALEHWSRSGTWDADPRLEGLQPETDPGSYNGFVWALARDLYLPPGASEADPRFAQALAYYEERAYRPELLWDWTGKEAALDRYIRLIDGSDDALRTATVVLGAVVANHLLAGVDAFISARGRRAGEGIELAGGTALHRTPSGTVVEWRVEVRP